MSSMRCAQEGSAPGAAPARRMATKAETGTANSLPASATALTLASWSKYQRIFGAE